MSGIGHIRHIGGAAALLSVACAAAPLPVHAGDYLDVSALQGMVCQISMTIQTAVPLSTSIPSSPTQGVSYNIVASGGSCVAEGTSMSGAQPFAITANGRTEVAPTCADFVIVANAGVVTIGTQQFPTTFSIVGPSADSQWVMEMTPLFLGSAGAGTAQLSLDPASLQACTQPGGTSTLTFSGVAVFAF